MKTNPIDDVWAFLVGGAADQRALGPWQNAFVILFAVLLASSLLMALAAWRRDLSQRGPAPFWIWLFRLLIGCMWFQGALWKLPFPVSGGLQYWTEQMAENAAWPWFADMVRGWMLPHMAIVDPLVFAAEMGLAVSFMLGLFVRPVATLGAIYVLGLWIGLYRHPNEWPWEYIFLSALQGMFAVAGGRRSLGLDALLAPLWRRSAVSSRAGDAA